MLLLFLGWVFALHDFFLPHLRALSAKVALFRVLPDLDFFILRSFDTGIFEPFFVLVDFRSLPRLAFLILMGLRRATRGPGSDRPTDAVHLQRAVGCVP